MIPEKEVHKVPKVIPELVHKVRQDHKLEMVHMEREGLMEHMIHR